MRSTHNLYKHYALELSFGKNDIVFLSALPDGEGGRNKKEKHYEKGCDCHWCLWWNRKLDRKTTGKRWTFGGRELRGKTSTSTGSCCRYQSCGGTGRRCASRCSDCLRRGATFQRVDGSFRQTRCGG